MKIFHLASEYPPQKVFGLGRFVYDISVESARQGHEVHVITNSMSGKDFEIVDQGVYVHRVHFPPPPKPGDSTTTVVQFNTQIIERAVPLMNANHPDVINTHDWLTFLAGRSLSRIFSVPHILTIHDTMVGKKFGNLNNPQRFAANIEHCGCRDADLIICCSHFIKNELIAVYQALEEKIRIIPCAVEEKNFAITEDKFLQESFRSVLTKTPEEVLVFYIGRLDQEKGLDVLLNAIPKVLSTQYQVKFILAGQGEMAESINAWISQHGLTEKIKLVGYVEGLVLSHLYHAADIQVIPSTYEPFGIVALEGMINGLAVIIADSGGLQEIVEHETDGLKVPPKDHDALAKAIVRLLADPDLRQRLGKNAYQKASKCYNWEKITQQTLSVYQEAKGKAQSITHNLTAPTSRKTWIIFISNNKLELSRQTMESILNNTEGDYEIIVVDNGSDLNALNYFTQMIATGQISRLVFNKPGSIPQWQKCSAMSQAIHILQEESYDYLAWIESGVIVKPKWLQTSLNVLQNLPPNTPVISLCEKFPSHPDLQNSQINGFPVKFSFYADSDLWIMPRSFFGKFGLPPIGMGSDPTAQENHHYSYKLRELNCKFAMLEGMINKHKES